MREGKKDGTGKPMTWVVKVLHLGGPDPLHLSFQRSLNIQKPVAAVQGGKWEEQAKGENQTC